MATLRGVETMTIPLPVRACKALVDANVATGVAVTAAVLGRVAFSDFTRLFAGSRASAIT
jgi:hypothetical protein